MQNQDLVETLRQTIADKDIFIAHLISDVVSLSRQVATRDAIIEKYEEQEVTC